MHAVVTGAAGFIGGHLVRDLTERGYRVTGIDREPTTEGETSNHLTLDLAHPVRISGLAEIVATAQVVFHLAGRPGVRGGGRELAHQRHRDNVVATAHVLRTTSPDTHIVTTSSSSVYGGSSMRDGVLIPSRETDPLRPVGDYALSKVLMERLCATRRESGGSISVIRPFTVAGERQRPDMAFAIWLNALQRGEPITLFGSGERSRDVTDVSDVVEGLIRAAETRVDSTVNLGTGVTHRLLDMARALLDVSGLDGDIVHAPVSTDDVGATLADTERCRELLGFVPETDLHAVLERVVSSAARPALAAS
jgi:nucleoside-diphosphate-sugar epimerase